MKNVRRLILRYYLGEVIAGIVFLALAVAVVAGIAGEKAFVSYAFGAAAVAVLALIFLGDAGDELRRKAQELLVLPFIAPGISKDGVWRRVLFLYGEIPYKELDNDRSLAVRRAEDAERIARFFGLLPIHARFGVF